MSTTLPYVYKVTDTVKISDGDSGWLRVDVGFRQTLLCHYRLDGWDTPEVYAGNRAEREAGRAARDLTVKWLTTRLSDPAATVWARSRKDPDDFGRWLLDIWAETPDGATTNLGDDLTAARLATTWPTRWREVYQ